MDLGTAFLRSAERSPGRRAVGGPRPLTYAEWDSRIAGLARGLLAAGVRPGDRVTALLEGGEPLASLHLAAQRVGAVSVPLSVRFSPAELAYCLDDAAPVLAVVDDAMSSLAREALDATDAARPPVTGVPGLLARGAGAPGTPLPPPREEAATSVMLYTSGTTGRPKGVPRSHRAEYSAALAHLIQARQPLGAVSLGVMPMFHTMGLRSLLASVLCSGTWVPQAGFDAAESAELIAAERIDTLYLVPTAFWSLARAVSPDPPRSVKRLAYAGAPMSPALAGELTETFRPECLVNHFGSTEVYTFSVGDGGKPGCAGRAGVFGRLRLVSPAPGASPDDLVPPGDQGQVIVSMDSPEAFGGYWHRADADARAIRDGWYYTGDLGQADDDGDLWVSGRTDDMINSGGENIYPDSIERIMASAPGIDRLVISGTPHEKWGTAVTAFFVPSGGTYEPGLIERLEEWTRTSSGLPPLHRPKRYVAVTSIPTSAVGKILRRRLTTSGPTVLADSGSRHD